MQFKFKFASDATGNEFTRTFEAATFDEAQAVVRATVKGAEQQVETYNDGNGWKYVPRWKNERDAAGI